MRRYSGLRALDRKTTIPEISTECANGYPDGEARAAICTRAAAPLVVPRRAAAGA